MQFRLAFALLALSAGASQASLSLPKVAGCEDCSQEEELLHFGMLQVGPRPVWPCFPKPFLTYKPLLR